jgi:SsrA-binding protein
VSSYLINSFFAIIYYIGKIKEFPLKSYMGKSAHNKRSEFHYHTLEIMEAGISLLGWEVKSVRAKDFSLKGAFVSIHRGEMFLKNAHIGKYKQSGAIEHMNESRERKLLLHKNEIIKLATKNREQGVTIIPLDFYTKKGKIKVKISLVKGKTEIDKRQSIKKRETERVISRLLRNKVK